MEENFTSLEDNACKDFFVKCYSRSSAKRSQLDPNAKTLVSKLDFDSRRLKIITECMEKFGPKRKFADGDDACKRMKTNHDFEENSLYNYNNNFTTKSKVFQALANKQNNLLSMKRQSKIEKPGKSMHLTMKKFSEKLQDMKNSGCFSLRKSKEEITSQSRAEMMSADDLNSCFSCSDDNFKNAVDEKLSFPNNCIPHQTCISNTNELTGCISSFSSQVHILQFNNTVSDPKNNIFDICTKFHNEINKTSSKLTSLSNDDVLTNKVIVFNKKLGEIFSKNNVKLCSKNIGSTKRSSIIVEKTCESVDDVSIKKDKIQTPVGTPQASSVINDDSNSSFPAMSHSSLLSVPSKNAKSPSSSASCNEISLAPVLDSISSGISEHDFITTTSLRLERDVCFDFEKFRNFITLKSRGYALDSKEDVKCMARSGGNLDNEVTSKLENFISNNDSLLNDDNVLNKTTIVENQSSEISKSDFYKVESAVSPLKECSKNHRRPENLKSPSNRKLSKNVKSAKKLQTKCLKTIRRKYYRKFKVKHSYVIPNVTCYGEADKEAVVDVSSNEELDKTSFISVHQTIPFVHEDGDTSKIGDPKQIQMRIDSQHHQDISTCHSFDCKESDDYPNCHVDDDSCNLNNGVGIMKDRSCEDEEQNCRDCDIEVPVVIVKTGCNQDRLQSSSLCLSGDIDLKEGAENSGLSILSFCKEASFDSQLHFSKPLQTAISTESWIENHKNNVDLDDEAHQSDSINNSLLNCNWLSVVEQLDKGDDSKKSHDDEAHLDSESGHDTFIETNNNDFNKLNQFPSLPPILQKDDLIHELLDHSHCSQHSNKGDFHQDLPFNVTKLCFDIDNDKFRHDDDDDDDDNLFPQSNILIKISDQSHVGYVSSEECKLNKADFNNNSPFGLIDHCTLVSKEVNISLDTNHSDASQMTVDSGVTSKVSSLSDCPSSHVMSFNFEFNKELSKAIILQAESNNHNISEFSGSKINHFCENIKTMEEASSSEDVRKDMGLLNSNFLFSATSHDSSETTVYLEQLKNDQQVEGGISPKGNYNNADRNDAEKQSSLDQESFGGAFICDIDSKSKQNVEEYGEMIDNNDKFERNVGDDSCGVNGIMDQATAVEDCNRTIYVHKAIDNTGILKKSVNKFDGPKDRCSCQDDKIVFGNYAFKCYCCCKQFVGNRDLEDTSFIESMNPVSPSDDDGGGDADDDNDKDDHSKSDFQSHCEDHDRTSLFGSYFDSDDETHLTSEEKLWDNITDNSDDDKTSITDDISKEDNIIKESESSYVAHNIHHGCASKHHATVDRRKDTISDDDFDSFQNDICDIDYLTSQSKNKDHGVVNNESQNCFDEKSDGDANDSCDNGYNDDVGYNDSGDDGDGSDDCLSDNLYVENSTVSKKINFTSKLMDDHWLSDVSITDDDTGNSDDSSYVDNEYHSKEIQGSKGSDVDDINALGTEHNDFNEESDQEVNCSSSVDANSITDVGVKCSEIKNKLEKDSNSNLSPYSSINSEHNVVSPFHGDDDYDEPSVDSVNCYDVENWSNGCHEFTAVIAKKVSNHHPDDIASNDYDYSKHTDDGMNSKQLFGDDISSSDESSSSADESHVNISNVSLHFDCDVDNDQCSSPLATGDDTKVNNKDCNSDINLFRETEGNSKFEGGFDTRQDSIDENEVCVNHMNGSDGENKVDDHCRSPSNYYSYNDEIDKGEVTIHKGYKLCVKLNNNESELYKHHDSPSRNTGDADVSENSSSEVDEEEYNDGIKGSKCYKDEDILFDNYHGSSLSNHEQEDGNSDNDDSNVSAGDNEGDSRNECAKDSETNSSGDQCYLVNIHTSHPENSKVDHSVSDRSPSSYQSFPNDCPGKLEPFDPSLNPDSFSTNENCETFQTDMLCNFAIKSDLDFDNDLIGQYDEIGRSHDNLYCRAPTIDQGIDSDQKMSFPDPMSTNVQSMMAEYADIYNRMGYSNSSINLCSHLRNSQLCVADLLSDLDDPYSGYPHPESQVNNIYKQYSLASTYRDLYVAYNYTNGYDIYRHYNDIIKMHCRSYNHEPTSDEEYNGLDLRIKTNHRRASGSQEQESLIKEVEVSSNNNISEAMPIGLKEKTDKLAVQSALPSDFKNKIFMEKDCDNNGTGVKYCVCEEINRASCQEKSSAFCISDEKVAFSDSDFRKNSSDVYKEITEDFSKSDNGGDEDDDEAVYIGDFVDFGNQENIEEKSEVFINLGGKNDKEIEGDILKVESRINKEFIEDESDNGENYITSNSNEFQLDVLEGTITISDSNSKGENISIGQNLSMRTDKESTHPGHNSAFNGEIHKVGGYDCDMIESIHDVSDDILKKQTHDADINNYDNSFDEASPLPCAESNFATYSENVNDGDKNTDDKISRNSIDQTILKSLTSCDSNFEQLEKCCYTSVGQKSNEVVDFLHEMMSSPLNLTLKEFSCVAESHVLEKIPTLRSKETEPMDKKYSISHKQSTPCDFREISKSNDMNAICLNSDLNFNSCALRGTRSEETMITYCSEKNMIDGSITAEKVPSPAPDEQFSNENAIVYDNGKWQEMYEEVCNNDAGKNHGYSKDVDLKKDSCDNNQGICEECRVMECTEGDITELNKSNALGQGYDSSHHQGIETSHKLDEINDCKEANLDCNISHNFNNLLLPANASCESYYANENGENVQIVCDTNDGNRSCCDLTFDCTGYEDTEQHLENSDIKERDNSYTSGSHFVKMSEGGEQNATCEHITTFVDNGDNENDFEEKELIKKALDNQKDSLNDGMHAIISCKETGEDIGFRSNEQFKLSNHSNIEATSDDVSLLHDVPSTNGSLCDEAKTKGPSGCDICFIDNPSHKCVKKGNNDLEAHNAKYSPQLLNRNEEQYEDYVISTEEYDDLAYNNQIDCHNNNDNDNNKGDGLDSQGITDGYPKESFENPNTTDNMELKHLVGKVRVTCNGDIDDHQNVLDKHLSSAKIEKAFFDEKSLGGIYDYNMTNDGACIISRNECDLDYIETDPNSVDFHGSLHVNSVSCAKTRSYSKDELNNQMVNKSPITFGSASNLGEDSSNVQAKHGNSNVYFAASNDISQRSNCETIPLNAENFEAKGLEKSCNFDDCYCSDDSLCKCIKNKKVDDLHKTYSNGSGTLELNLDKLGDKSSKDVCYFDVHSIDSYIPIHSPSYDKVNNFLVNAKDVFDSILEPEVSSILKKDESSEIFKEVELIGRSTKSCSVQSKEGSNNDIASFECSADTVEQTVEDIVSSPPKYKLMEKNCNESLNDNHQLSDNFEFSKSDYNPDVGDDMPTSDLRYKHDVQKSARNVFDDMRVSLISSPLMPQEISLEKGISNELNHDDLIIKTSGDSPGSTSQIHQVCLDKVSDSNSLNQKVNDVNCISEKPVETSTLKKDFVESRNDMSENSLTNLLDGFDFSRKNYQAPSENASQSSSNSVFQVQSDDVSGMLQEEPVDNDPEELQAAVESILNIDFFSSKYADDEDLHHIENNEFVNRYDCNYFGNGDGSPALPSLEGGDAIDFLSNDILNGEEDDEDEASRDGKELAMKFYSTCQQKDHDNCSYNIHTPTSSIASKSGFEGSNIRVESSASLMETSNSKEEIPSDYLSRGNKANFFKSFKSKWLSMNNNSDPKHFDKQALSQISEKASKVLYCRSFYGKDKKRKNLKRKQRKALQWKYLKTTYIIQKFQRLQFQAQRRKEIIQKFGRKPVKDAEAENHFIACFKSKLYIGYEPNDDFSLNDFKNKNIFYLGSPCGMSSCSFFRESERREHLDGPETSGHEKYLLRKPVFLYESGCLGSQMSFVKLLSKSKLPSVNQQNCSTLGKASVAMQQHPSSSCSYKDILSQGDSQNMSCIISAGIKNSFDASYNFKDDGYALMVSERKRAYHYPNNIVEMDNMPKEACQMKCKDEMLEMKCPSMPYYAEQSNISINSSSTHILRAKPEPHYNIHLDQLPSYAELNNVCSPQREKAANRPIRPTPLYKEGFSGFPAMGQGFPNYKLTHFSAHTIGEARCLPASDNIYKSQPGILPENSAPSFVSQMKNGLQSHLASRLNLPPVHSYVSNLTNPRMVVNQNDHHMFGVNYMDHSSRNSIRPESSHYHLQHHYIPYTNFQAPNRYPLSYSSYPSGSLKIGVQGSTVLQTEETERCHTATNDNAHRAPLRSQATEKDSFKHSHIHSFNSKDVFDLREVYLPRNSSDMSSYSMFKQKAKKFEQPTPLDHNFSRNKMDKKKDVGMHPSNLGILHSVSSKGGSNRLGNRASLKANYQIETILMNPGNIVRSRNHKQIMPSSSCPSSNPPISHPYYQPNMNAGFTEIPIYKFYPDRFSNYSTSVIDHPNTNHYNPSPSYRGDVNIPNVYRYSLSSDKFNGNLH